MELRRLVSDGRVRAALAGALLHTGLAPDDMPAPSILALAGMLRDGLFLPESGMSAIPAALASALRQRGGELRFGSPVTRIVVERGRACGVDINGAHRMPASAVISTISPMATFTTLIDAADAPRTMMRRVGRTRLSHRAVSVQIGLANHIDAAAVLNMVLPGMERQREVVDQNPFDVLWPVYSVPTRTLPELAPPGGSAVEMFIPLGTGDGHRRWDTSARQAVAGAALAALRRFHALDVTVTRIRTPDDFAAQMHLFGGALYGLSPATAPHAHFAHRSAIGGLLLAGQSTYPGYGVAPAMMSGIFAADAALVA
jgi:phytoene dehydrogenase-like protein